MTDSENGPDGVNNRRTRADSDTNVTHGCSGFEPTPESSGAMAALTAKATAQVVPHFFDNPIDIRRTLIAKREIDGADTPAGHTYSNVVEILDTWLDYERPAWATYECQTLAWMMNYQIKRLERRAVVEA